MGVRYCYDEVWISAHPNNFGAPLGVNIVVFGPPSGRIGKDSPEWNALYDLRQSIERMFKGMRESRRLERHCVRGKRQVTLHIVMSVVAFQATALTHVRAGRLTEMRWMVKKVA